jgi:hypothetical protein
VYSMTSTRDMAAQVDTVGRALQVVERPII